MNGQNLSSERNYGIDLLRITAMFMVVILHILGCGGILKGGESFSANYVTAWFLETAAYCAVNVFAMISGYAMAGRHVSLFKIIPLWLLVFFYSSVITILFRFVPFFAQFHEVTNRELIDGIFFPVLSRQYWYFSCYVGLFFFIPFINRLLENLNQKEHRALCLTIFILFSAATMLNLHDKDTFNLNRGYSVLWLVCLYIVGAYLKKYPLRLSKSKAFLIYLFCVVAAWLLDFPVTYFALNKGSQDNGVAQLFVDYLSPFIFASGIMLIVLFSQIRIEKAAAKKAIRFASSLAFSVYIIHVHPLVFFYVLKGRFAYLASENPAYMALMVILISLALFASCMIVDLVRHAVFSLFGVEKIPKLLENKFIL